MEDVIKEAEWLAENGVTELIVIAQDTTRYGEDLYGASKLPECFSKCFAALTALNGSECFTVIPKE